MSCACTTQQTSASGAATGAGTTTAPSSSNVSSFSNMKVCNRCLFFWIAVGIAVLFLLKRS